MSEKNIMGISGGFHDAGLSVISPTGEILFASHSERFTKIKHDPELGKDIVKAALAYGDVDTIAYYENHWLKKWRQFRAGQPVDSELSLRAVLRKHIKESPYTELLDCPKVVSYGHHKSHAAAGFQTSPYTEATVVVIDAIGEMDTISIWQAHYDKKGFAKYKKVWSQKYPHSIGMFYSALTAKVGLRPMDEEYILMGMAAYGNADVTYDNINNELINQLWPPEFKQNLHIGLDEEFLKDVDDFDIAAGAQKMVEELIYSVMAKAKELDKTGNLVYMGGVALNCSANRLLGKFFDNIWIMPNPGDAGSSLGAAALAYGKKLQWNDAFLGYNIPGAYPIEEVIKELEKKKIVGVASGRAEFGPRALGNRSLLADPRGKEIKDKVNEIKRRQKFRPFAPVILEEYAEEYFWMPHGFDKSPYMQVTAQCKVIDDFPAIVHADGSSRVQTVPNDGSGIRQLLEEWYKKTGCPMLLNTSLNIRGEPMVNDRYDADRFQKRYDVRVCS